MRYDFAFYFLGLIALNVVFNVIYLIYYIGRKVCNAIKKLF